MDKKIDKETRFYIDLDLKTGKILSWDYGQRQMLKQVLDDDTHHRVSITKGQFNKLEQKYDEVQNP